MTTITGLTIVLAVLMILSGGRRGAVSFISLLLNFTLLFLTVILIAGGLPILTVTFLSAICILAITIYLGNNEETETNVAFLATLAVLGIMVLLVVPLDHLAQIQGFSNEESEEIEAFNLAIGVNFEAIVITTTLLSTLGAIAEAAIAIASGMTEIIRQTGDHGDEELRKSGRNIGFQIMGMTFNTLFFGMFGGNLALFILLYKLHASFGYYLNSKIFVSELFVVIYSAIAVILVIWITIEFMILKAHKIYDRK
ncbi:YibE/F family protein [Liquorilactobacillus oeni]|uniref:Integral membrane protein n=1 Tax=Liquorilactobacillus oeni DSM 19972 TaxID=1423777 RepID=A0A0R1MLG4_9LACO|nr:YibE/F family protein [Liquorilactobacillus oeni]KRL06210.1 integral membrane protein [Liquorilactobacillus oeni DSM 19972]